MRIGQMIREVAEYDTSLILRWRMFEHPPTKEKVMMFAVCDLKRSAIPSYGWHKQPEEALKQTMNYIAMNPKDAADGDSLLVTVDD